MKRASLNIAITIAVIAAVATPAVANPSPDMDVYEVHSYYKNFIPFGVGQFQNGDDGKGNFFRISELATGGISAGIFLWQMRKYGFSGAIPVDDVATVRRLQQIQIISAGMFYGLVTWGIIDALIHYQPIVRRRSESSTRSRSFALVPVVGRDAIGFGISWEAR